MSIFQIVAGNFVKNKVVDYFDYEVHGELKNADYIDRNGLFIGNHHYPITKALNVSFPQFAQSLT